MELVTPEDVGMDSTRIARLSNWQQDIVRKGIVPSSMALVSRRGKVVYFGCSGEKKAGIPLTSPDTIFRIYSMTKPITSTAVMMLVEEGKLLLSDPIWLYLGENWRRHNMKVLNKRVNGEPKLEPCETSITVLQLLTHCSGLGYDPKLDPDANPSVPTPFAADSLKDFVDELSTYPLNYQPGTHWKYSFATDVLSRLVEVISGVPFAAFLHDRIFEPLGMTHTAFHIEPRLEDSLSDCWLDLPNGKRISVGKKMLERGQYRVGIEGFGGGGLLSTIRDYHRFTQMLMRKGELDGVRILSRRTVEYMTTNHIPEQKLVHEVAHVDTEGMPNHGFGLGFSIVGQGPLANTLQNTGTYSWGGMAKTNFICDPKEDLTIIFMTQVINLDDHKRDYLHRSLENQVYASLVDSCPGCSRL